MTRKPRMFVVSDSHLITIEFRSCTFFSLAQFQPKKMSVYLSTKEYQSFNFFSAILENCHLKTSILKSSPLSGQTDGLEIIRFKTPYLYNQGGYNSDSYKGFLIYNRIDRFDQDHIDKTRLQGADLRDTDQPNYFFTILPYPLAFQKSLKSDE